MVLYILLGIIALLAVLLSVPAVLRVTYDGGNPEVKIHYLFLSYTVYPREEKEPGKAAEYFGRVLRALKKMRSGAKKKKKPASGAAPRKSSWQTLRERRGFFGAIGYLARVALRSAELGAYLISHSSVSRMKVHVAVGGCDAADAAVKHGKWCAALYPALSLVLCSVKSCRGCSVNIVPDFFSQNNRYDIDVKLKVRPGRGAIGAVRMLVALTKAEISDQTAAASIEAMDRGAAK